MEDRRYAPRHEGGETHPKEWADGLVSIFALTNVNGAVMFFATDGVTGVELWKSDGTTADTALVKDIFPGPLWSAPSHLTALNGTVMFCANDGVTGGELWKSDGNEAGTVLVKDINQGGRLVVSAILDSCRAAPVL